MNSSVLPLLSYFIVAMLPAGVAFAGPGPHAGHASAGRSTSQARASFRGSGAGVQRFSRGFAANNRAPGFSRASGWNGASLSATRAAISRARLNANYRSTLNANRSSLNPAGTNWNRFGQNRNRFATNFNGANRVRSGSFNRNGNWWRHHHHDGCDNSFIYFGGFGYPFFSAWDYGLYPSAYYPAYPYTPYYYDPYGPTTYGDPGYPVYGGGGYSDDSGYTDPDDGQSYRRGGDSRSVVSQVQERLARAGYYKGSIDGVKGSRTYYAIRAYQREHNLPVDGEITDQLLQDMGLR